MCPPYERHKKYCLLLTCVSKEWFEKKMVHFSMILIVSIYSRLVMSCLKHTVTINQINSSVNHLSWFFIRKTYLFSQKMPFLFILWGYPHKKKHFFLKNFCFFCLQSRSYLLWWMLDQFVNYLQKFGRTRTQIVFSTCVEHRGIPLSEDSTLQPPNSLKKSEKNDSDK